MSTVRPHHKIGILYPAHSAEDDYPTAQQLLGPGIEIQLVHTAIPVDAHRVRHGPAHRGLARRDRGPDR